MIRPANKRPPFALPNRTLKPLHAHDDARCDVRKLGEQPFDNTKAAPVGTQNFVRYVRLAPQNFVRYVRLAPPYPCGKGCA